jgi:hypothetical protein
MVEISSIVSLLPMCSFASSQNLFSQDEYVRQARCVDEPTHRNFARPENPVKILSIEGRRHINLPEEEKVLTLFM